MFEITYYGVPLDLDVKQSFGEMYFSVMRYCQIYRKGYFVRRWHGKAKKYRRLNFRH